VERIKRGLSTDRRNGSSHLNTIRKSVETKGGEGGAKPKQVIQKAPICQHVSGGNLFGKERELEAPATTKKSEGDHSLTSFVSVQIMENIGILGGQDPGLGRGGSWKQDARERRCRITVLIYLPEDCRKTLKRLQKILKGQAISQAVSSGPRKTFETK